MMPVKKYALAVIFVLALCLPSPIFAAEPRGIFVSNATSTRIREENGTAHYVFELTSGPSDLAAQYIFDPGNGEPLQVEQWTETIRFEATYKNDGTTYTPSITVVGYDSADSVRTGYVIEYDGRDGLTAGGSTGCNAVTGLSLIATLSASYTVLRRRKSS